MLTTVPLTHYLTEFTPVYTNDDDAKYFSFSMLDFVGRQLILMDYLLSLSVMAAISPI